VEQQEEEEAIASSSRRRREEEEMLFPRQLHKLWLTSCPELRLRLQTLLCPLIVDCPKFLSCYASSSSSFPFPSSLQFLYLSHAETLAPLSNLASLATLEIIKCGDLRRVGLGRLLAHGCLQELTVLKSTIFSPLVTTQSFPPDCCRR